MNDRNTFTRKLLIDSDLPWLLKMMEARIIQSGVATKTELAAISHESLAEEINNTQAVFIRDMNFGICVSN